MVVYVTRVIFQSTGMFNSAHRVMFDAASHRRGRHRGRRGGMINSGSWLFRANLLFDRSTHSLQRSTRLMMLYRSPHGISRWLTYHRIDRSHRFHRSHRLGRTHAVLDWSHRRRIGRSARSAPASRYGVRTVAHVTTIGTGSDTSGSTADTMTLRRPTDRVRIHFHFVQGTEAAPLPRYHSCRHMVLTGSIILAFMSTDKHVTVSMRRGYTHWITHAKPHSRKTRG